MHQYCVQNLKIPMLCTKIKTNLNRLIRGQFCETVLCESSVK